MYRAVEVVSGVGVFLLCLTNSAALFQCIFSYQRSSYKIPPVSIVWLCIGGTIVLLSYVGAFILLSWAKKPK
jgi:hypothetical protein